MNKIDLSIAAGQKTFPATLQQVYHQSNDAITIGGRSYRLVEDTINGDFADLITTIKTFSWIHFESINDFKETLSCNSKFSIFDARDTLTVQKFAKTIFQKQSKEIEQVFTLIVKDRMQLSNLRLQAQQSLSAKKSPSEISHNICEGVKSLMGRMYDEGVAHLHEQGLEPPCKYCVVGLGSIARDEAGPFPDFDNIIMVERRDKDVEEYFLKLNQYVADRVHRLGESLEGNKPGLRFCWGNLNPQYQPYESRYSSTPTYSGRADLLIVPYKDSTSASVKLGDVRDGIPFCGTDLSLYGTYKNTVFSSDAIRQQVHADMERQAKALCPNESNTPSPITAAKLPALVHIKEDLCRLPASSIGALALYHEITASTTLGRIDALKVGGYLEPQLAEYLKTTMEILIKWRIQVQSAHSEEFEFIASSDEALAAFEKELPERIKKLETTIAQLESNNPRDDKAINNARGQLEFALDCQKGIIKSVKDKPSAFSQVDRQNLTDIVLPTLHELYRRVDRCLNSESKEINPIAFR